MSGNGIAELAATYLNDFFLQALRTMATLCWMLEKVAAGCMRFLTETNLWELLLQGTLETLRNSMPGILRSVFFGGGNGAGLVYIALMLAGIFMVIPALSSSRVVDPARVIMWSIVVGTLFIGSLGGYDLVGYVEQLRQSLTATLLAGISGGAEDADLDQLVQVPMYATDAETERYDFELPAQFASHYFSAPDPARDYDTYVLVLGVWPVQHTWSIQVEKAASQAARRTDAQTGLAVALLTLVPGVVLFLFGLIYAALAAAALVLILFFLVSLPVGFFEFGTTLLTGIVRQYVYLFAVTLLTVTLMAVMVASGQLNMDEVSPGDVPNMLMTRIPILLVVTLALSYVSSMATSAMRDTFGVVSGSVRASMAPLNASGRMPAGSGVLSDVAQAALNVSGSAALAGMTGGAGMALMAGAGAAVSSVSAGGGRAAATLAQGLAPDSGYASVFASAARSSKGGVSGMAYAASQAARSTRAQRQRHTQRDTASTQTLTTALGNSTSTQGLTAATPAPEDQADYAWDGTNAGTFKVADSALVTQGMQAFRAGEKVVARDAFTRAFGSRQVAEQVVTRLSANPRQAELPIEAMTTQIERSAHATVRAGKPLFDKSGALSPAFQTTLAQNVKGDKQLQGVNVHGAGQQELIGALAGASVRPLSPLWLDPRATQKLAQTVLDPDAPQVATGDTSALLSLQGLAHIEGWGAPQLEAVFEATRSGQSRAALSHGNPVKGIAEEMATYKELQTLDRRTATEAARLALLVTRQAQGIGGPTASTADPSDADTPPPADAGTRGAPHTPDPEGSPSGATGSTTAAQDTAPSAAGAPRPADRHTATTRRLPEPNLLGGVTAPLPASRARAEAVTAPLRAIPGTRPVVASGVEGTPTSTSTTTPPSPEGETAAPRRTTPRRIRRGRRQENQTS